MKIILLLSLFHCLSLLAVPEHKIGSLWQGDVLSYYENMEKSGILNKEGMTLPYSFKKSEGSRTSIVILPGRSEPALKYAELIYDLRHSGANIFIIDHQGQGDSGRHLGDPHKGHVWNFQNYVDDMAQWMDEVVLPMTVGHKLYLIAHSMGATIGVHYLAQYPKHFHRAVLNSPMMQINTDPYSERVAWIYSGFLVKVGKGQNYAPDRGPYVPEEFTFESQVDTGSRERFEITKYIFDHWPHMAIGGPTSRWVNQALGATKNIQWLAPKITVPVLLLQALNDKTVENPRQTAFCNLKPDCTLVSYPTSRHEILMERDEIRHHALVEISKFLSMPIN